LGKGNRGGGVLPKFAILTASEKALFWDEQLRAVDLLALIEHKRGIEGESQGREHKRKGSYSRQATTADLLSSTSGDRVLVNLHKKRKKEGISLQVVVGRKSKSRVSHGLCRVSTSPSLREILSTSNLSASSCAWDFSDSECDILSVCSFSFWAMPSFLP